MSLGETIETYGLAAVGLSKGICEVYVRQPIEEIWGSKSANLGWAALVTSVLAYDLLAPETLSEGMGRAIKRNKPLTLAGIALTASHLADLLPDQIDPFHLIGERVRGLIHG